MTDHIHSCGYHCIVPACVLAQRDELRDRLFGAVPQRVATTQTQRDDLYRRLGGPTDRPTYNESKRWEKTV